jgi:transketolase
VKARVISMPSWELFERQSDDYRQSVLPPGVSARVAVEQASPFGWDRYTGPKGAVIAMHSFGSSAPLKDLQRRFGFTPDAVIEAARSQLVATDQIGAL